MGRRVKQTKNKCQNAVQKGDRWGCLTKKDVPIYFFACSYQDGMDCRFNPKLKEKSVPNG
jgi:hypothetical protein